MTRSHLCIGLATSAMILCLFSCRSWNRDIVLNGIHFEKIAQEKNGTYIGVMKNDSIVQGFPCEKGWIYFSGDWRLQSFRLSEEYLYEGIPIPAGTWILFPRNTSQTGFTCVFPFDFTVQGYSCKGGGGYSGIHTSFYAGGKLRSFYPPKDVSIYGVPCKATLMENIEFHENGSLKKCRLSRDFSVDGKKYRKGTVVRFDEQGMVL